MNTDAPALSLFETELIKVVERSIERRETNLTIDEVAIMLSMIVLAVAVTTYVVWQIAFDRRAKGRTLGVGAAER